MTKIKEEFLPPIIIDIVQTVLNDKNPMHVRENACGRLEQIEKACNLAASQFRTQQIKVLNQNVLKRNRK